MINVNKIICAIDTSDISFAEQLVSSIEYKIIFKIGLEFYYNFGLEGINRLKKIKPEMKLFLDLKLHDIPNTVKKSIIPLLKSINPFMLTIHVSGGASMLEEVAQTVHKISNENNLKRPMLLGVTILTSLSNEDRDELGWNANLSEQAIKLAILAKKTGLDGVIASPLEIKGIKKACSNSFKVITPGIRMPEHKSHDQARIMTPIEAIKNGADFIVIGRPIVEASDPNMAIKNICNL
tara:strand:+ start:362 stop:1072 length:711 start_codon:yes stop_codon:yes gene_type:complete